VRIKGGTLAAFAAYFLWGILPVYWKALEHLSAPEIFVHRIIWSLVVLVGFLALTRNWDWLRRARREPRLLLPLVLTAALVTVNWLTYLWANNTGHIVEASLGYFINPLVNVLLGVLFLRERPRSVQWTAVGLAAVGVTFLTISYGRLPWIALTLALSFGFYWLIRKTTTLASAEGLTVEMALLFVPALVYLGVLTAQGATSFAGSGPLTTVLLVMSGFATTIPMVLFTYGARQVTLTTLGLLQYIAPTLQFLLGAFVYGEGFRQDQMVGFGLIWVALALYSVEGIITARRRQLAAAMV